MLYDERLRKYEQEKQDLRQKVLCWEEFEKELKKIADKWKI